MSGAAAENAYSVLTREAGTVPPGSEGLVVLPYFSGERTPINDPRARGVYFGLTLAHTRALTSTAQLWRGSATACATTWMSCAASTPRPQR